jgi:hypothetical protein
MESHSLAQCSLVRIELARGRVSYSIPSVRAMHE